MVTFGKLNGPESAGAYNNYYKADADAKNNPTAFKMVNNSVSKALNALNMPDSWLKPTLELVARESSFNHTAANPNSSAKGLFQFLDSTRKDYQWSGVNWNNPDDQAKAGLKYIIDRYGTPEKALAFWDKNKWY